MASDGHDDAEELRRSRRAETVTNARTRDETDPAIPLPAPPPPSAEPQSHEAFRYILLSAAMVVAVCAAVLRPWLVWPLAIVSLLLVGRALSVVLGARASMADPDDEK